MVFGFVGLSVKFAYHAADVMPYQELNPFKIIV